MKICDITNCIEEFAPLMLQESYDNSGLIIGEKKTEITKALICLDVTEEIIDEAIAENFQLVI
ncbi:MAG: Nif3-like dinuclear metal center hexameric protein, partial [Bacteroidetes bacterium]|nr:Nif3-like dinuclear metal center hexameric protein [Bacteroidota bacterium]